MPLLKRASKRQGTRLYVVSDFHASDPAWRKLLNAIRLNVYKADAVLYAGTRLWKNMTNPNAAKIRRPGTTGNR